MGVLPKSGSSCTRSLIQGSDSTGFVREPRAAGDAAARKKNIEVAVNRMMSVLCELIV